MAGGIQRKDVFAMGSARCARALALLAGGLVACSTPASTASGPFADATALTDGQTYADAIADAQSPSETTATDGGATDAWAIDTDVADAAVDVAKELSIPQGVPSAHITAPASGSIVEFGKPLVLAGTATDTLFTPTELTVQWASNVDGELGTSVPDASGNVSLNLTKLSSGPQTISLTVSDPSGSMNIDTVDIGVCAWGKPDTFDTVVTGGKWKTYGDAYFDPGGWLEMTGNVQSKKGAIFNTVDFVSPGDVQLSFKIATGGYLTSSGQLKGADGFALSVVDVKTVAELENYIATAGAGGCLGYGVSGDCKQNGQSMAIDAFHIEIDTWQNTGDPNWDPTPDNHIGIMQNGDASNHYLWASVPFIEDLNWHPVTVEIKKDVVRVTVDGNEVMNKAIPNFKFRGGFIGFSGTTGWATNFHRFDDLQILQQCLVK